MENQQIYYKDFLNKADFNKSGSPTLLMNELRGKQPVYLDAIQKGIRA